MIQLQLLLKIISRSQACASVRLHNQCASGVLTPEWSLVDTEVKDDLCLEVFFAAEQVTRSSAIPQERRVLY